MMNTKRFMVQASSAVAVLVMIGLAAGSLQAATPYTETFSEETGGWQEANPARPDGMVVTREADGGNPGGVLRMRWNPINVGVSGVPPVVSPDVLVATGEHNTAHFIGDLDASEAWLIGFDVNAVHTLPDYMYLALHSGDRTVTRVIMTAGNTSFTTNTWYSMRYTLLDPPAGFWGDDAEHFDEIISDVTSVSLVIQRRGEGLEDYLIDNVFIDRLPSATSASLTTTDGGIPQLAWGQLRAGERYRVEAATDLMAGDWITVADFVAGEDVFVMDYDPDAGLMYFRVVME
jgi:hypothetical protein